MWRGAGGRWGRRRTPETDGAEAELTRFGERLAAHPFSPSSSRATGEMIADYAAALDAYELAGRRVRRDAQGTLRALDDGERALARLDARLAGGPLPVLGPLCFFDPRHGRSVREVSWTPDGGTARMVPVCAADAVRLTEGNPPIRTGRPPVPAPREAPTATAPAAGPRLRDRYPTRQLLLWGALGASAGCLAVPVALGEAWLALTGLVLLATIGSLPLPLGLVVRDTSVALRALIRRGHLVTAHHTRTLPPDVLASRKGWRHEYAHTTDDGSQLTWDRAAWDGTVQPLPRRRLWYVAGHNPGQDELHGPSYPFGLGAALLVSLPVFLAGVAADLAVCPGLLIWALVH
ncbi:hypothetical protein EDD90_6966 [Streptomyces sp. Ag109_O5-1]|uniref:hypothetical protein n=1 Tax=Streptomyces sp. Ag109_O5-1 TaxID=1938851 RepID=UPI000F4F23FE|nr:hypothetical protein [Streptomyces sp. Ag109_O5-1]RPE43752.1 hypothetical protein EDD90_6966 [Streptomyces sp. Ag109_O5-1]